jgi:protease IV
MISIISIFLRNFWRRLINLGRRAFARPVSWVRIEVSGSLPELADEPSWWQQRLMGVEAPLSLQALRRRFERLEAGGARGVLLVVRDLSAGWAAIEGLHELLRTYRAGGGRVVAYLEDSGMRAYVAACAAEAVLMAPTANLNLIGLRVEATFLADALRMVGLETEVIAVSPYKSGGDGLARAEISPEAREQLERLTDERFALIVDSIAAARGLAPEQVRALIDRAPLAVPGARQAGLLDGAYYEDELEAFLAGLDGRPGTADAGPAQTDTRRSQLISWSQAERRLPLLLIRRERRYVGVVRVEGAIAMGSSRRSPLPLPLIGGAIAGADTIIQALRQAERNQRVAAVVLHIDSPGGDALASDLIWREAQRLARRKPLVVSMGDVAASGGYYVAVAGKAIFTRAATLTGSIGVLVVRPNLAGLIERTRIGTAVISRGANSGIFASSAPLKVGEREALERSVAESYATFKARVRDGRGLSEAQLDPLAGGRVWTGREAAQHGLVDGLSGFGGAVARARELADLRPDPRAPLLILRGGRRAALPPRPWGIDPPVMALNRLLEEALRTRTLAALPWLLDE